MRDRENLLLPARQARRGIIALFLELREQLVDAREFRAIPAGAARIGADQQVVFDRQRGEHAMAFQHLDHAGTHDIARCRVAQVAAVEFDAA